MDDAAPHAAFDLAGEMARAGARARAAATALSLAPAEQRTAALVAMARRLRGASGCALAANARDLDAGAAAGLSPALLDRLALTPARIAAMAEGVQAVAALSDPLGAELARWAPANGLDISRIRTAIGVIAVIFESRPNVAADAAALCVRSGNAVFLRGGSDCLASSLAIVEACRAGLEDAGLPADAVQMASSNDRAVVGHILAGLGGAVDLVIPRGGKSLVARVQVEARVPVLGHLEGLCHTYVHRAADPEKARAIVLNAKMRRVSVCGSTETLLIDAEVAGALLPLIAADLGAAGCTLRGDGRARALVPGMSAAVEADWTTEYLAPILSVRVVDGVEEAIAHIARYGSGHTDAILTEDAAAADLFTRRVDSAIVLVNASTQFADGAEFGFGAEIGIATAKLHARGPVGAEQLTTYKYVVRGTGQTRP